MTTTTFRAALSALANLNVAGVQASFDVDALPAVLDRGQLPALLALLVEPQTRSLFREGGEGLQLPTFRGGASSAVYSFTHLLLIAPRLSGGGARVHFPALVSIIDAYMTALGADPLLGGALEEMARVRVEPSYFVYGGQEYSGCAFRHEWRLRLGAA